MDDDTPNLDSAYALKTPQESRALYAGWAETYDTGFAQETGYELHLHAAQAFATMGGTGPVLDVGAGTGLCGQALAALGVHPIEATDISPEMLHQAMQKGVYARAIEADLTQGLPIPNDTYSGIVSSGTFTTGHVGPTAFDELLRVARPGARFALSINVQHFQSAGFGAAFDRLGPTLSDLILTETRIYGERALGSHRDDTALIASFHKR